MKNITAFIKKYWILLFVSLAAILYIVNVFLKNNQNSSPSTTPVPKTASFGSLTPGASTTNQVATVLGKPIDTKSSSGMSVSDYSSSNQYRFHQVTFTNGVVTLIKEVINSNDSIKSDYITSIYGTAPYTLYNNNPNNYFDLYVYPQNGIAYIGHTDGTVLEIWYFKPTPLNEFINNWGAGYSINKPTSGNF